MKYTAMIILILFCILLSGCSKANKKCNTGGYIRRPKTEAERMYDHEWNGIPY